MIKKFTLLFLLSLLTLAFSQTDSLNMRLLGVWEPRDDSELVCSYAVVGNYLYVFTGISSSPYQKIYSIDISGAPSLEVVNMVIRNSDLGEYPFGVLASNDSFLYCVYYSGTGGRYGIGILRLLGDGLWEVAYSGDIVEGASGMYMYPYENDGRIYLAVTCFVEIDGERKPGIRIVDVTDPSSPELLDWYYVPEEITDPYYMVRHRIKEMDVLYPHLFVFETIEYIDTSWGGGYDHGYVQVKMFDLRDLSAPPVVWRSEWMGLDSYVGLGWWGGIASSNSVIISYRNMGENIVDIIYHDGMSFTDSCEMRDFLCSPRTLSGDTFYVKLPGLSVVGVKVVDDCVFDTLGYYSFGDFTGGNVVVDGDGIYLQIENTIYIIGWSSELVNENDRGNKDVYTLYPTPVVCGERVELNRKLDRKVNLYDISGKLKYILEPGVREIDTRGLSPGVYFLISDDKKIKLKFVVI